MKYKKTNIVLIGMAGSGKSTIGKLLADSLSYDFVDTDKMIEGSQNTVLQELVERSGPEEFRKIEESILLSLKLNYSVIATGGSSVYSRKGMEHLKKEGYVILLDVSLPVLEKRVQNVATRGLVRQPGQSFAGLCYERKPLYLKYADLVINCSEMFPKQVLVDIQGRLVKKGWLK